MPQRVALCRCSPAEDAHPPDPRGSLWPQPSVSSCPKQVWRQKTPEILVLWWQSSIGHGADTNGSDACFWLSFWNIAVWPWASHSPFLSLSFLFYPKKLTIQMLTIQNSTIQLRALESEGPASVPPYHFWVERPWASFFPTLNLNSFICKMGVIMPVT